MTSHLALPLPMITISAKDAFSKEIAEGLLYEGTLFICPKVGLEYMFQHIWISELDDPSKFRDTERPCGAILFMHLLVLLRNLVARRPQHENHISNERYAARALEVGARFDAIGS